MLELKCIAKSYTTGDFTQTALDGVSIAFRDNEFVAILGPSGSGKTTLLNIVGGLDHYDSGDLVIDGVSTKQYKDRDWDTYRNNRVGFVFQSYNLIPHQSVLANVELALTLSGVGRKERKARAMAALEEVGLKDHANKRPNQLSGGQAQRVAIARALVNNPTIVLADEPTGALDSKTSVDVMNLLTEIAKDRLVIMVTHNPELAERYANRTVQIADGRIIDDSNPFDPTAEAAPEAAPVRKTAMSLLTALSLSAQNLMTKKGRTIMTAFAGSIGIIGIALILALATGANNYIRTVEEETLSEYPLTISKSGFSFSAMMGSYTGDDSGCMALPGTSGTSGASDASGTSGTSGASGTASDSSQEDSVRVSRMLTTMVAGIGTNDLASLKRFLDANGGNIHAYARSIEYSYGINPLLFAQLESGTWQQVNPDIAMSDYTTSSYSSSFLGSMYSTDIYASLPELADLYVNDYDVVAGRWPERYDELVIVLTQTGRISDIMLYDLGLKDMAEAKAIMEAVMNGESSERIETSAAYSYDDLLGLSFKLVNVADTYEYDEIYGVWKDKSDDEEFMASVLEAADTVRVVGLVRPDPDANASMLTTGVYYLPSLTEHVIELAAASEIVQQQLANPDIDVITGKPFDEVNNPEEDALDLSQIFSVDQDAFSSAFSINTGAINLNFSSLANVISVGSLTRILQENLSEDALAELAASVADDRAKLDEVANIFQDAMTAYLEASAADDTLTPAAFFGEGGEGYAMLQSVLGEDSPLAESAIANALTQVINKVISQVGDEVSAAARRAINQVIASLPNALSIDTDALSRAFNINMSADDLSAIILSMMYADYRTYDSNLKTFNYADLESPILISIYPKDFASKEVIIDILNTYNDDAAAAGEEERVITFSDLVGTLMSSVTDIIDVISYMLIAFVSISLVVSSIMIGIITYISVLERKKEIGVLRAIGARKRDIRRVFNAETFIEGLIAGLLGVGITALICIPASAIVYAKFGVANIAYLPAGAAVVLVVISVFLTLISGLIPASAAAKADPVEALRSE